MIAEVRKIGDVPQLKPQAVGVPKLVDLKALAEHWDVPLTWLQEYTRSRCKDPIPCIRLGIYVRVDLQDPALLAWLTRRRVGGGSR